MNIHIGKVNGLFHTEGINHRSDHNTGNGERKNGVLLRRDIALVSQKGKAMSMVERLMKQKDFIRECKDSLIKQMADQESGYCSADLAKKVEEYEKQLDSIDDQIAEALAKQNDGTEQSKEKNTYNRSQQSTKQEWNNKKISELTEMSVKLNQSEITDSVKNRLEGEKNVLEAELKSGDSERKRQRIAEIDDRTEKLAKETFAGISEVINEPTEKMEHVTGQASNSYNLAGKLNKDAEYYHIIEKSDDGFHIPTMDSQLSGTFAGYFNEAYKKGKAPGEDVYEHIVNMHVNSLTKAYQDIYNDIVTGYENGTREVWTQNFDEGADYIEFELEGKNYRFHKLTMEEELARLDEAYKKKAKDVADKANLMINTEKMLEKVIPEYQEKMRQIAAQRAGNDISEVDESLKIMAERVKNIRSMESEKTERINIFEMLMEARKNWLSTGLAAV